MAKEYENPHMPITNRLPIGRRMPSGPAGARQPRTRFLNGRGSKRWICPSINADSLCTFNKRLSASCTRLYARLKPGEELSFPAPVAFLLQDVNIWSMIQGSPLTLAVMGVLICFSIYSWTIIFSKWAAVRGARKTNDRFLRAFRKSSGLEAVVVASERYRPSPLVTVFDFGYEEVERQVRGRNKMTNRGAVERALQIGVSEEMTRLERNMTWLATTATASPFIGLLGTVLGIIQAFMDL